MEVEGETQETALRSMIEKRVVQVYGMYIELFAAFLCFLTSVAFIITTYIDSHLQWLDIADYVVSAIILLHFLLKLYISQHRLQFFLTPNSLLTLFIVFFVFFCIGQTDNTLWRFCLVCSRLFRIIQVVNFVTKYIKIGETDVNR